MIESTGLIAAVAVAVMLFLGAMLADARRLRCMQEEAALRASTAALKAHYDALRRLDDRDMPSDLIDLAMSISRIVNDRRSVELVVSALRSVADKPDETEDELRVAAIFRDLARSRPDLAQAFVTAVVSAMAAVVCRWPHSAMTFNPAILEVVREPAEETMRVVRYARNDPPPSGHLMAA